MKKEQIERPKKPNEIVRVNAVDHIRIVDKKTNKELVNKRG